MLKMNGFSEHPLFWFPDLFHPLKLRGEALFIEPSSIVTQSPLIACSMRYARMWQVTTALHAQARICANRSF